MTPSWSIACIFTSGRTNITWLLDVNNPYHGDATGYWVILFSLLGKIAGI